MVDLSTIAPDIEEMTLVDREKKAAGEQCEFVVTFFVPTRVAVLLLNRRETIAKMLGGDFDDDAVTLVHQIFERVFRPQHEFMTAEWCERNIDLSQALGILLQLVGPLFKYLEDLGLTGKTEKPTRKNP